MPKQPPAQRPPGARGTVTYTNVNGVRRAMDSAGTQWHLNRWGTWTRKIQAAVPTYNRFTVGAMGRGGVRKASFKATHGSAARYAPSRLRNAVRKTVSGAIATMSRAKRSYRVQMLLATTVEGHIATDSATAYAVHFGAPAIRYEWCHLLGHGGGGSDDPSNIVAASAHCNSEQLAIESVLYRFHSRGVSVRVAADLVQGTQHLARAIHYYVLLNGAQIWHRAIDGYLAAKPTWSEVERVKSSLLEAISTHLPPWR